ncbi:MAG: hypothetical protein LBU86_05915 [Oscillospiraceae bacterium]|nr:hypothetical protein [Oscillospiraceae bacterium]
MIGESIAIVVVLLVTAFMGARAGKKELTKLTLPFLCVPACVLTGEMAHYSVHPLATADPDAIRIASALIGAVLGGALCALTAKLILPQKARFAFFTGCLLVVFLMALAYIMPILGR